MTDIDKRIDEIMAIHHDAIYYEKERKKVTKQLPLDYYTNRDFSKYIGGLIEAVEIIKHLQAQVVERDKLLRYATLDELAKESERLGFYDEEASNKAGE